MSAISDRYAQLGGLTGLLGKPLAAEFEIKPKTPADKTPVWQCRAYERGMLYFRPEASGVTASGPWIVAEHVRDAYKGLSAHESLLKFPTGHTRRTNDGRGAYQTFEQGTIFWSPKTGGIAVFGWILEKYFKLLGGPDGPLGYPIAPQQQVPTVNPTGWQSTFEHGAIYWSNNRKIARAVWGSVYAKWQAEGGFNPATRGYPVTDVLPVASPLGETVRFEDDSSITAPPAKTLQPMKPAPLGPASQHLLPAGAKLDYHNATATEHAKQVALLTKAGCRLVALGVFGDPTAPRFVASWSATKGPEQKLAHSLSLHAAHTFIETQIKNNFHPVIVAATGPAGIATFAVVCEARTGPPPVVQFSLKNEEMLDPTQEEKKEEIGDIAYWNAWARANRYRPRWLQRYGSGSSARFVGIWEHNSEGLTWRINADFATTEHQTQLDVQKQVWARPAFVTRTVDGLHATLFVDDQVGAVVEKHDLTGQGYLDQLKIQRQAGLDVASVAASKDGSKAAKFSAVFVQMKTADPRTWRITGQSVPSLVAFDELARRFMTWSQTRAGSLAIARDGRLVYARAFTLAEADYPTTQPKSLFRCASCTKPIVATILIRLAHLGIGGLSLANNLEDKVQPKLSLRLPPGLTFAAGFENVTIMQMLVHRAGMARNWRDDDAEVLKIFQKQNSGRTLPITSLERAAKNVSLTLNPPPGTATAYSNVDYRLLGYLIEKVTGKTFDEAFREHITKPLGYTGAALKRAGVTGSLLSTQRPGESRYPDELLRTGPSVMTPDRPTVPMEYGTKNWSATAGSGSLACTPADYVKILDVLGSGVDNAILPAETIEKVLWAEYKDDKTRSAFADIKHRNGKLMHTHGGTNVGANTLMAHMPDDRLSIVWSWNGGHEYDQVREQLLDTADAIPAQQWPTHDLFPSLSIPTGVPNPV